MAEQSKQVALLVFLFIIFIFLAAIIFVFIFGAYRGTSNYTEEMTRSSIECAAYTFRIEGGSLLYENGTLSFVFDPRLGGAREKNALVIVFDGQELETAPVDFTFRQRVRIRTAPLSLFSVYPKGCSDIVKTCYLDRNECD